MTDLLTLSELRAAWLKAEKALTEADEAGVSDEEYNKAWAEADRANAEYAAAYQKNRGPES